MTINWSGYEWQTSYEWEPVTSSVWKDPAMVKVHGSQLELKTGYSPKEFVDTQLAQAVLGSPPTFTAKMGIGCITSNKFFSYGTFEIECMLPSGYNLWPAFWLWGRLSWPPEIDIFEGWTNNKKSYCQWDTSIWKIIPNIHYGVDRNGKHPTVGGIHMPWTLKNPAKHFHKYKLIWDPEYISIYYNNIRVRKITDPMVLLWFRNEEQRVVINNGLTSKANPKNCESSFIINYFKYTPKQI